MGEDWTKTNLNHLNVKQSRCQDMLAKDVNFNYATVRQNNFHNKGVFLLETRDPFFIQGVRDKLSQIFMQNNVTLP